MADTLSRTPQLNDIRALLPWIAEQEAEPDRDTAAVTRSIQRLKDAKIGALRLPVADGGAGISLTQLFELVIDIAAADSNVAHALRNHWSQTEGFLINRTRIPAHDGFLKEVALGRTFGASVTELGKQNVGNMQFDTALTAHGDHFRLSGSKYYSTGNLYVDYIYVHAVDSTGSPVKIAVPRSREGVDVADDWDGFGQQFTGSGSTFFNNVKVYPNEIIDESQAVVLPYFATFPQLYLSAIVAGILQRVVVDASALLKARERNFYHAVDPVPGEDPLLLSVIGRLQSAAHIARVGVLEAADWLGRAYESAAAGAASEEAFARAAASTAQTKVIADDLALRAAGELFEVAGASAARRGKRLDRHWRNLRTVTAHNPIIYKALAIGRQAVHGTPLPSLSYF